MVVHLTKEEWLDQLHHPNRARETIEMKAKRKVGDDVELQVKEKKQTKKKKVTKKKGDEE